MRGKKVRRSNRIGKGGEGSAALEPFGRSLNGDMRALTVRRIG